MTGGGGEGGWADERRSSVGVPDVYPGTQIATRASWAMMRFAAQLIGGQTSVHCSRRPTALYCRNLRYSLTINNSKY